MQESWCRLKHWLPISQWISTSRRRGRLSIRQCSLPAQGLNLSKTAWYVQRLTFVVPCCAQRSRTSLNIVHYKGFLENLLKVVQDSDLTLQLTAGHSAVWFPLECSGQETARESEFQTRKAYEHRSCFQERKLPLPTLSGFLYLKFLFGFYWPTQVTGKR